MEPYRASAAPDAPSLPGGPENVSASATSAVCTVFLVVAILASLLSTSLAMIVWWLGWPLLLLAYLVGLATGLFGLGERGRGRRRAIVCVVILGGFGAYFVAGLACNVMR